MDEKEFKIVPEKNRSMFFSDGNDENGIKDMIGEFSGTTTKGCRFKYTNALFIPENSTFGWFSCCFSTLFRIGVWAGEVPHGEELKPPIGSPSRTHSFEKTGTCTRTILFLQWQNNCPYWPMFYPNGKISTMTSFPSAKKLVVYFQYLGFFFSIWNSSRANGIYWRSLGKHCLNTDVCDDQTQDKQDEELSDSNNNNMFKTSLELAPLNQTDLPRNFTLSSSFQMAKANQCPIWKWHVRKSILLLIVVVQQERLLHHRSDLIVANQNPTRRCITTNKDKVDWNTWYF
jgi:hypothetical protein